MVRDELSSYKAPRRFEFVGSLPRDAVGKVRTKVLKEWANGSVQPDPPVREASHAANKGMASR
jgi:acyl-CoA synthetase (AMP-forming)/AMP-acid ligase II